MEVRLDLDPAGFQTDERVRDCLCEHVATIGKFMSRVCHDFASKL